MGRFNKGIYQYFQDQSGDRFIEQEAAGNIIRLFHRMTINNIPENHIYNFGTVEVYSNLDIPSYDEIPTSTTYIGNKIVNLSNVPFEVTISNTKYYLCQTSYYFYFDSNTKKEYTFAGYNSFDALQNKSSGKAIIRCYLKDWNTLQTTTYNITNHNAYKFAGISQRVLDNKILYYLQNLSTHSKLVGTIDIQTLTSSTAGLGSTSTSWGAIDALIPQELYRNVLNANTNIAAMTFVEGARIFFIRRNGNNIELRVNTLTYNNGTIAFPLIGNVTYSSINWIFIDRNFNLFFSYGSRNDYYAYYAGDYSSANSSYVGTITQDGRKYAIHGANGVYLDKASYLNYNNDSFPVHCNDRLKMLIEDYNAYRYKVCYETLYYRPSPIWSTSNGYIDTFALPIDTNEGNLKILYQSQLIDETFIFACGSNTSNIHNITTDTRFLINEPYINNTPIENWRISSYVLNSIATNYDYKLLLPIAFVKRLTQYGYDKVYFASIIDNEIAILSSDDGFTNSYNQLFYLTNQSNAVNHEKLCLYSFIKASNDPNCHYIRIGFLDSPNEVYYFCVSGIRAGTYIKLTTNMTQYIYSVYIESLTNEDRIHVPIGYFVNNGSGNVSFVNAQKNTPQSVKCTFKRVSARLYMPETQSSQNNHELWFTDEYLNKTYHYDSSTKPDLGVYDYFVITSYQPPLFGQQFTRKYSISNPPKFDNYGFSIIGNDGRLFQSVAYYKDLATMITKTI